jgi:HAD superfamily hydrolase (TIGR01509 family)
MHNIKLIIFDLDGTLIDAYPAIIKSFNYTMQKIKIPKKSNSVIRRAVGWGDENLLKPFINPGDLKKALAVYRKHHKRSLLKGSRPFPEARQILGVLKKKGYKLAIASNRPTRFSWIIIRHLKLDKYFSYVLCKDRLKYGKPHPAILNRIRQKFSVRPDQAVYIGDMAIDAQAGRRAGIKTIIVTTGSSTVSEIKKERPYRVFPRITELLKIL